MSKSSNEEKRFGDMVFQFNAVEATTWRLRPLFLFLNGLLRCRSITEDICSRLPPGLSSVLSRVENTRIFLGLFKSAGNPLGMS